MGGSQSNSKDHTNACELKLLRERAKLLQQKLDEIMHFRETANEVHEQEIMIHALKESEWKREQKWLKREVRRMKKALEAKDQEKNRRKEMKNVLEHNFLLDKMRVQKAQRDEAVDKWKRLYLAIKIELDSLINITHKGYAGETAIWKEEEEYLIDELRREVRAKEETIELLQAHIASMEQEESRREREVDILKQSLRIMNHKKPPKHISRKLKQ